ncbi:hypothetical protein [Demequina litorisediminis]|uniref:Thioredoxin domain-containing protein n=1 Tax=Demequina litorisediminis TaxID=1849022 RepID=A0ABQ6IB08_9MICO|nr:hypothetical protein [Demequina litorisediminis]GMA35037.1 hypothetical protein GCM10025876_12410 [Demequina litorisediminis]
MFSRSPTRSLLHLLKQDGDGENFALLFGGTWCHNTRAVIKQVNAEAQRTDVPVVYNVDLVLDGGTVNGSNGSANPIHIRDTSTRDGATNFRPSYLYGDVVNTYFPNLVTQYDPATSSRVDYFPGGDTSGSAAVARRLQVPFVLEYERGTGASVASDAVKRQWIQSTVSGDVTSYTEYMTEWWFTVPSAQARPELRDSLRRVHPHRRAGAPVGAGACAAGVRPGGGPGVAYVLHGAAWARDGRCVDRVARGGPR